MPGRSGRHASSGQGKPAPKGLAGKPLPELEHVLDTLRALLPELRERYGVRSLGVFGSYAHGQQRKRSDLDVLVEFDERPLSLFGFIRLENELTDLLGMKVDLVEKAGLKPLIGQRILEEVVPI